MKFDYVLLDCKHTYFSYFENSPVEFNQREVNKVAHTLAIMATSLASFNIFIDIPTYIV